MILLLILLIIANLQDSIGKQYPVYAWAIIFAVINIVFLMMSGDTMLNAIFMAFLMGCYAWSYFKALRIFGNHPTAWISICGVGALLPMVFSILFLD